MRHPLARTTLLAVTAALALTLTACGDSPRTGASAVASVEGISTQHGDADVGFLNDMTPHHTGAVAMAELAGSRASSTQVEDLAQRILTAQEPELARMAAMARAWGVTVAAGEHGGEHGGGHGGGMDDDAAALTPLTGAAFDREFLTRMTAHHEGALPMAQAELDGGQNPQAQELARSILTTQTAEIAEMTALLARA